MNQGQIWICVGLWTVTCLVPIPVVRSTWVSGLSVTASATAPFKPSWQICCSYTNSLPEAEKLLVSNCEHLQVVLDLTHFSLYRAV
jgi:hypothetical protein